MIKHAILKLMIGLIAIPALYGAPGYSDTNDVKRSREVAFTFDDLPMVAAPSYNEKAWRELTRKMIEVIRKEKIPAVGFVNGSTLFADGKMAAWRVNLLRLWLEAGLELGNHTFSHPDLHRMPIKAYKEDILKTDAILKPLLAEKGNVPRFFRHPMLHTGTSAAMKKEVTDFLATHGYTVAPVTLDHSEWIFAKAYALALKQKDRALAGRLRVAYLPYMEGRVDYFERQSMALFGREVRQVMLLHANALNADTLAELAAMMRKRGYAFITLDRALADEAYTLPDAYVGPAGISWLHRWCFTLGGRDRVLPNEPRCPAWVMEAAGTDSE